MSVTQCGKHLLADLQSIVDDCVANNELKDGSYVRISDRLKSIHEHLENSEADTKLEMFVEMVKRCPFSAIHNTESINVLDEDVIRAVLVGGWNEDDEWWADLAETYVNYILDKDDPFLDSEYAMDAVRQLVVHKEMQPFFGEAMESAEKCFICAFQYHKEVDEIDLEEFVSDIVYIMPRVVVNLCNMPCCLDHTIPWENIKRVARSEASEDLFRDSEFVRLVGPAPKRKCCRCAK